MCSNRKKREANSTRKKPPHLLRVERHSQIFISSFVHTFKHKEKKNTLYICAVGQKYSKHIVFFVNMTRNSKRKQKTEIKHKGK